jgi:tetratricopeptide (TPR) repeat protein
VDEGNRAYERSRYEQALAAYDRASALAPGEAAVVYNRGNALHGLRRYDEATIASLEAAERTEDAALRNHARYALGNHAFRRDDLQAAREAYAGVLLADPGDEDARHNLELVLLMQQQRTPQQEQPGQQGGEPSGEPGEEGSGQPQPGQPGQSGGGGGTGQPAPGPQSEEEAQAALAQALAGLGENVSAEDALGVLDRLRALNSFERIEGERGGALPDR